MKAILLSLMILASGCKSSTDLGPCVGVADEKNPALEYKLSIRNAFLGIFFFELILPPIFVLVDETYCPVAKK